MAVGDSINSLRRQLRESERDLARLNREMEKLRREMENSRQEDLRRLEKEMSDLLKKRTADIETRYEQLLKEYQKRMQGELRKELKSQEDKYKVLKKEAEQVKLTWQKQSEELQAEVDKLKKHVLGKDEDSKTEAEAQLKEMDQDMEALEAIPCDFFKKGRKNIVSDMLAQAKTFLANGFYQAALGLAVAASSDARRLKLEVEEYLKEWENTFSEWKKQVESLEKLTKQEQEYAAEFLESPVELTEKEKEEHDWSYDLNYWSHGEIKRIIEQLHVHQEKVTGIEKTGVTATLKAGKAMTVEELREQIADMKKIWERWGESSEYYKNVFRAFQERYYLLGEAIIERMEHEEVELLSDGFRMESEKSMAEEMKKYLESYEALDDENEDHRALYCMTFRNKKEALLSISIVSVRIDHTISNQVCYCLELCGALDGDTYCRELKRLMAKVVDTAREHMQQQLSCEFRDREKIEINMDTRVKEEKLIVDVIKKIKKEAMV